MDAHFLRRLVLELTPLLAGARVEKIFHPADATDTLVLFAAGTKLNLVLRSGRSCPLLFPSSLRPDNPPSPPAATMRLRKYLKNKKITNVVSDWINRRFALEFAGCSCRWLIADLHHGLSLSESLPAGFGDDVHWPAPPHWPELLRQVAQGVRPAGVPLLTPALRRTLVHMDPADAHALMLDLENPAGGDTFVYYDARHTAVAVSAWPLAPQECSGWTEAVAASAMEGARLAGEAVLYTDMARRSRAHADKETGAAVKRVQRALARLQQEEERMRGYVAQQQDAVLLQRCLYRFASDERRADVRVEGRDGAPVKIALDPLLTVRENMEAMFRRAAKGKRGLENLAQRRAVLENDLVRVRQGERPEGIREAPVQRHGGKVRTGRPAAAKSAGPVLRFRSSDGFLMLRGRNAAGNDAVVKGGSAFDLWFHAQDGPGAHVVVRLDHPGQHVPEQTMIEAASLAAARSWQRDDAAVRIMCALLRDVRKVKGAAAGAVRVDAVLRSLVVAPDSSLEESLRI
jgi:predicted ribosome quality control (RQC) complex YloA/Tae2 family protein